MLGQLDEDYLLTDNADKADVIVVNTCSFIQSATEESIETILEMSRKKAEAQCQKLVVTGCMVQRYGQSLEGELPEVDFFLGTGEYHRLGDVLRKPSTAQRSYVDTPMYIHDEFAKRVPSWKSHSAYLKISEGCNHRCAFCIIPTLRGKLRSRSISSLVTEAEGLVAQGVKEINLVSQDSTAYGRDLKNGSDLGGLLRALTPIDGLEWLRLHYAYPIGLPESLLKAIAEEEKVCSYIDIPLQHASGNMLRRMRRGVTRTGQERILNRIRSFVPDVAIRSTFIVGFPGETEDDYAELRDFIQVQKFDRVGVFTYFQETGTEAATMDGQLDDDLKQERQEDLMGVQAQISKDKNQQLIGQDVRLLVDGTSEDHEWVQVGRMESQAPEVDGQVYIDNSDTTRFKAGDFINVRITQAEQYDLAGVVVDAQ
jgi:ribosomal protein S12 methylthiotransferase